MRSLCFCPGCGRSTPLATRDCCFLKTLRSAAMFRCPSIPLCATLLAVRFYALCSFPAEPPWLEIHSTHYTVITDAGEKKGREIALRFEQMRAAFANLLAKDRLHES